MFKYSSLYRAVSVSYIPIHVSTSILCNPCFCINYNIIFFKTHIYTFPWSDYCASCGHSFIFFLVSPSACAADVGEGLRQRYEAAAEDARQRAIRSTEEVVRREEEEKRERALEAAKEEWVKERQQLFVKAHDNQLKAIARHSTILEEKLRKEFKETLKGVKEEKERKLLAAVEETWKAAAVVREAAVFEAREEERERAASKAKMESDAVEEDKQLEKERSLQEKMEALEKQRKRDEEVKDAELEKQKSQLVAEYEARLRAVREEGEERCRGLQEEIASLAAALEREKGEVEKVCSEKNEWEEKHSRLRAEFSDFINQVPGFRGDFLLS